MKKNTKQLLKILLVCVGMLVIGYVLSLVRNTTEKFSNYEHGDGWSDCRKFRNPDYKYNKKIDINKYIVIDNTTDYSNNYYSGTYYYVDVNTSDNYDLFIMLESNDRYNFLAHDKDSGMYDIGYWTNKNRDKKEQEPVVRFSSRETLTGGDMTGEIQWRVLNPKSGHTYEGCVKYPEEYIETVTGIQISDTQNLL